MSHDNETPITSANDQTLDRYLGFSLGAEEYAIPLLAVKEVIAVPEITPIPFAPPYFLGIMNLRGQVISVVDLRNKFNIKPKPDAETSVIICDLNSYCLGVVVDSINSVLAPKATEISEKPTMNENKFSEFITGVYRKDKKLVLFIDIARCLNLQDQAVIAKTVQKKAA